MTNQRDVRRDIVSYLTRHGWEAGQGGPVGELWRVRTGDGSSPIAVPFSVPLRSDAFDAVVDRLARFERTSPSDVAEGIEREFQDVQRYRIGDAFIVDDAVLLDSAATVLASARRLIRAAATTSRKPRARIGSNYSPPADELAAQARLTHTRKGSFVLPVIMPVEPPELTDGELLGDKTEIEPAERRVTRTLAMALTALDRIAVRPARDPRPDDIAHLVQSGVSKELVSAVRAISLDSGVHAFDSEFRWAPGLRAPGGVAERVVISDEAAPILAKVEKKLQSARPEADESVSGQIVEIRHLPDEPLGEIAIRTIRNNRNAEIRITTTEAVIREAFDWAKQSRAIIARGKVVVTPGRPLTLPRPDFVKPIDVLFAIDSETDQAGKFDLL
ncbi:hypothetical protein [Agromyces albus]|uniref:hypothetical protein n=1 Tax=Agromyces albus TaxID=205332 RepID=UPI00277F8E9B|nr:hypothetical protein [Agromyces albus]MDQ0575234.1 hypothetical protein [Agromyces albus]